MCTKRIVIGTEVKEGERRRAVTPSDAKKLVEAGFEVVAQKFPGGVFADSEYQEKGIKLIDDTQADDIVVGTREFKPQTIKKGQVLLGFHHAHKEQPCNKEMLQIAVDLGATLFDYGLYKNGQGQPITTSPHAGMVGAFNGICAYLKAHGQTDGPVPGYFGTYQEMLKEMYSFRASWYDIRILVVGSGGCGRGAQKFLSDLGIPEDQGSFSTRKHIRGPWFKVLKPRDLFEELKDKFDLSKYCSQERLEYRSVFDRYIGYHDLLIHCPCRDAGFPQLVPESMLQQNKIPVISVVTCDRFPEGTLACTRQKNTVEKWITQYESNWVTAVDCLPSQIARTSSQDMSRCLMELLPRLRMANWDASLSESRLDGDIQSGFLVWKGEIVPRPQDTLAMNPAFATS